MFPVGLPILNEAEIIEEIERSSKKSTNSVSKVAHTVVKKDKSHSFIEKFK